MTLEERAASLDREAVIDLLVSHDELLRSHRELTERAATLEHQLEWLKRQVFGTKSERRVDPDGRQLALGEVAIQAASAVVTTPVQGYDRRRARKPWEGAEDSGGLRFDPSVPVKVIPVPIPELEGKSADAYQVIGEKVTERLAQRPASYVVLQYVRPVVKLKEEGRIVSAPAPAAVLERSCADVSLLAQLVIEKFMYHLPLYRQHQRMTAAGVHLSRATLTHWVHATAALLEPIFRAQWESVLESRVLGMDETPIKAGHRKAERKMGTGYFWPVYGDRDEIVFPFSTSRASSVVREILGSFAGVLLTDGYVGYDRHAERTNGLVHAQCWAHTRRYFVEAEAAEPTLSAEALTQIRALYEHEEVIGKKGLTEERKLQYRGEHVKPLVDCFFAWLRERFEEQILLPKNPFTQAANYALEREEKLRVFLAYPEVPLDTNHLEREIRPIAVGRKNWMFCWTELGAHCVGILQSLLTTCRLQSVDPFTYLVDVLQRIDTHPAHEVRQLTPRLWKEHFAQSPLRSAIDHARSP